MANTTNLGYQMPASPYISSGPRVTTDTMWQNYIGPVSGAQQWANQTGQSAGLVPTYNAAQQRASALAGASSYGGTGGGAGGLDIASLIQQQLAENASKEKKQEDAWQEEKKYMLGLPNQYANDPTTTGTQSLVPQLLANPEALNDATVGRIKNQNVNQIQAQQDNQFRQGMGTLAAGGATSARSINALRERLGRNAMAANQTQNTSVEVQRANQRNGDIANAANLGRTQSLADIGVPMAVGNSILANQPQYKANDYSGLLALAQQGQQNNTLNALLANGGGNGGNNFDTNSWNSIQSPVGNAGGRYTQAKGTNSTGAGFGFSGMNTPGYTSAPGFAGDQSYTTQNAANKWMQQPQMTSRR